MTKTIAMIPARYAATRFPAKLMQQLGDKPVIAHTFLNTLHTKLFDDVLVVSDSDIIIDVIKQYGGKAFKSKQTHESGTDRIAEIAKDIDADIIVNIQGDEPFVNKDTLQRLLNTFTDKDVKVASAMQALNDEALIKDPNYVKVTIDKNNNALFFSRSPIPYHRNKDVQVQYYEHIGLYAFRKKYLLEFTQTPIGYLENIEKIECLRYLENGIPIKMITTQYMGIEIDTPEDLIKANALLKK